MSFFKSKNDNENPDRWKEKYFSLLDQQDQFEKDQKANEDLLCKTIVRFALAVKGFNKTLDPHLDSIRDLLKKGVRGPQLQRQLETFSEALMAMEDKHEASPLEAGLLFDFLLQQFPKRVAELNAVQQRVTQGEFINPQRLFLALAEAIGAPEAAEREENTDIVDELPASDRKAICDQLIRLLDHAELPAVFIEDGKKLKQRLQSEQALQPIFDDAVALLLSIKKQLQTERQEMAEFLSTLTEELAELGLKASGVDSANEDALSRRNSLDQDVAAQMADLQQKSASATQLEPLKQLVNIRLVKITHQIQAYNTREQLEKEKNQRELKGLVQKIKDMESETVDLRSRLDVAQQKATRDPLTNLPNRLAFEERLAAEIARAQRYDTPLTLAVWDIDHFKNINDTYGHKSGDKALMIIAKLLSTHCRQTDFVARFGGARNS